MDKRNKKIPILDNNYEYVTVAEYSKITGKHEVTIIKWLKDGKIEGAVRLGGEWRIPVRRQKKPTDEDLYAMMLQQTEQAAALTRQTAELANEFTVLSKSVRYAISEFMTKSMV